MTILILKILQNHIYPVLLIKINRFYKPIKF